MKFLKISMFAVCVLALSCVKNDPKPATYITQEVDLNHLKIGQESTFLRYNKICSGGMDNYSFTGDTIAWKVGRANGQLVFQEHFSPHNVSLTGSMIQYPVFEHEDYLLLPERENSALFFFYGNDTLRKEPTIDLNLGFDGCYMTYENGQPFIGDEIGYTPEVDLQIASKNELTVVACVPNWEDVDAFLGYDKNSLEISHTVWGGGVVGITTSGWVRID